MMAIGKISEQEWKIECLLPFYMAAHGHIKQDVADLSGVARTAVSHQVSGSAKAAKESTIIRFCLLYGVEVGDMYVLAPVSESPAAVTVIRRELPKEMPDANFWRVSCRLQEIRKKRGLRLTDLHASTGLSRSKLTDLDQDRMKQYSFENLIKLCLVLNCSVGELLVLVKRDVAA